jgi:hypothetical protein
MKRNAKKNPKKNESKRARVFNVFFLRFNHQTRFLRVPTREKRGFLFPGKLKLKNSVGL